jgi:hypothetical protein
MVKTLGEWIELGQNSPVTTTDSRLAEKTVQNPGPRTAADDKVHTPSHYTVGGIETIDYIRAKLTPEQLKGYYLGNLLKYLSRAQHKDGLQDYKKAAVYLNWLIELESKENH